MATPDLASAWVQAFCREHFPDGAPRMVRCDAAPWAAVSDCFPNVQKAVSRRGGAMVLGWHLWEIPGFLLEAEYHAVWRKPSGSLVDITPQRPEFREESILFVPRPKDRLTAMTPDNLRCPLTDDPDLLEMCRLKERFVQLSSAGVPTGKPGEFRLTDEQARELERLQGDHHAVMARLKDRHPDAFGGLAP